MKLKKVIEVKRGEAIPFDAKWLKDEHRIVGSRDVDDGFPIGTYTEYEYTWFDIYEVEVVL